MHRFIHTSRGQGRASLALALLTTLLFAWSAQAQELQREPEAEADTAESAEEAVAPAGVVNLNTANEEELGRLPGIGPSRAQAILALRERVKRFERVEDLMRVKGIGRKTFRKLRPMLTLDGATTLQEASRTRAR